MSSENGQNIKLTVFGESHASAVGVVIEGLPAGEAIDEEQIMQFMRLSLIHISEPTRP